MRADAWSALPVAEGAAGIAFSVFAPRNGPELARVLAPGGVLIVVTPAPDHLAELAGPLGLIGIEPGKEERLEAALGAAFGSAGRTELRFDLALPRRDAADLAAMGPSARHLDDAGVGAAIAALPEPLAVTASLRIDSFRLG